MNVLFLLNHAGKAGTERYVETLARYLGTGRITPFFAYNEGGLLVERMQAMDIPVARVEMNSRLDLRAARALAELCKQWDVDLVHCQYLREHYTALLAKRYNKKIRVLYTNHFVMANDAITRFSNRLFDRAQDGIIAVCNAGREQLIRNGWSADKIQVVHNGVDLTTWAGERAESTLRAEFGIPEDMFVMLCASRFAHDKGHKYLLNSLKLLKERCAVPFCMVLAGDGPLLEESRAQAEALGIQEQVIFAGFRKDIKNLYKGSDLYVNASEHEALSFLLIEAMAAGLPVILTDMGGNRDIVDEHSGGGILVRYDDPESMSSALAKFLENPAFISECAARALEIAGEKFEIGYMCNMTWEMYQRAVKK